MNDKKKALIKKKVLIVTQEMDPYLISSSIGKIARNLPQFLKDKGKMEIRILMPRFGTINQRKHRLHEVVRLSGINIIIDEDDFPLVIKVASLPKAKMQVYFLDNEDFFKRKSIFRKDNGVFHPDNAERMIFFCKGVLETVRKFGWAPDVIHCHGWMTSLIPMFVKTAYKGEAIFANSKVIYSVYDDKFEEKLGANFTQKSQIKRVTAEEVIPYGDGSNLSLHQGGVHYADGVIIADENIDEKIKEGTDGKLVLTTPEEENYLSAYKDFYTMLLGE